MLLKMKDQPDVGLLMDLCAYLHYAEKYQESNRACQKAAQRSNDLYTKSIREQAAAYLLSDNAISFQGEDYERLFLHVIGMLNYAALNQPSSAMVEARKLDNQTRYFNSNPEASPTRYRDDPLGRYISGLLHEENREHNDALIDFKKSIEAFDLNAGIQIPPSLPQDAVRSAHQHQKPVRNNLKRAALPHSARRDLSISAEIHRRPLGRRRRPLANTGGHVHTRLRPDMGPGKVISFDGSLGRGDSPCSQACY